MGHGPRLIYGMIYIIYIIYIYIYIIDLEEGSAKSISYLRSRHTQCHAKLSSWCSANASKNVCKYFRFSHLNVAASARFGASNTSWAKNKHVPPLLRAVRAARNTLNVAPRIPDATTRNFRAVANRLIASGLGSTKSSMVSEDVVGRSIHICSKSVGCSSLAGCTAVPSSSFTEARDVCCRAESKPAAEARACMMGGKLTSASASADLAV